MGKYIVRRLLISFIVLIFVSLIAFLLPRMTPGDPVLIYMSENATPEQMDEARAYWGLDKPLTVQYFTFIKNAVKGDFGNSISTGRPVLTMIAEVLPNTIRLAFLAWSWAVVVGIPLGIAAAKYRNKIADLIIRFLSMIGRAMPHFWLGVMLILLFSCKLRILPSSGLGEDPGSFKYYILPAIVLGTGTLSLVIRMTRSELLEVSSKDYIKMAKAKGLRNSIVVFRHELKNALIPLVTVMGLEFAALMGGAIVTEQVFAFPGVGRLAVNAIYGYDYPVIQAVVLLFAVINILVNIIIDILYAYLDPQIRYS